MHNLATVFDLWIKLSGVHILLDKISKYMNHDSEASKAEVTHLLYNIFVLYDEKICGSKQSTSFSQSISNTFRSLSIFSFFAHWRHSHASSSSASSSSLSNELEFYLRNEISSALDENQIKNLDVLVW